MTSDPISETDIKFVPQSNAQSAGINWRKSDPDLNFTDPRLHNLLHYWRGKLAGRMMPARRDIDIFELKPHLGRLHLTDLEYNPFRIRYRLIGTTSPGIVGRDMTGRYFDEVYPPDILAGVGEHYRRIAENRRSMRGFGSAVFANKSAYTFETINLPLSKDGETVNMVFGEIIYALDAQDLDQT